VEWIKSVKIHRIPIDSLALFVIATGCLVEDLFSRSGNRKRLFADRHFSEIPRNLQSTNQRRPSGLGGGVGRGLGIGVPLGVGVGLGVGEVVAVGVGVAVAVAVGVA